MIKKPIPRIRDLFFTDKQLIVDSDEVIQVEMTNEDKAIIPYKNEVKVFEKQWLWLYTWFEMPENIPINVIRFIRVSTFKKKIPYKAIFTKPQFIDREHIIVPSFPHLAISETGECINYKTNHVFVPRLNPYGYHVLSLRDPLTNEYREVMVHQLVANAWIIRNQDIVHPVVNHKDGNKLNNIAANLEWVTRSENNRHARDHGNVGKEVICEITNRNTGEKIVFRNMTDAAMYCDIDVSELKTAKFNRIKTIADGKYSVRFLSRYSGEFGTRAQSNRINRDIPIEIMFSDGRIEEFDNIRQISSIFKIARNTVNRLLNSNGLYRHAGIRVKRKNLEWPNDVIDITQYKAVSVLDKATGKIMTFPSIKSTSVNLRISKWFVKRMIKHPEENDRYVITLIDNSNSSH